jgi:hypothetical protein
MGRIGWADALARRRFRDVSFFDSVLLNPILKDLLARTWLTERYDCAGNAIRSPFYVEYPELVAMLLRDVRYGIRLSVGGIEIDPLGPSAFEYHVGAISVSYAQERVAMRLPGTPQRRYRVGGMAAGESYRLEVNRSVGGEIVCDAKGFVTFDLKGVTENQIVCISKIN